jgi:UDP-GlcNAc:undecaprenyl-phosphate GlcNAc-1-phosphate transferase
MQFMPFLISLIAGFVLTFVVREISRRTDFLAKHEPERWNTNVIPISGGLSIFISFLIGTSFSPTLDFSTWGLLAGATVAFILGIIDDKIGISPPVKLTGQLLAASIIVFSGTTTAFFQSEILNVLISIFWLVAISNALNLLDNMDGLSSMTAFISAGFLAFFFIQSQDFQMLPIAFSIAGAVLGFLIFNFPPASIFMGDSGSLFLGITLAGVAIAREPQASNILAIMGVPALILMLPILDTAMVSLTRIFRGQSPAVGGRDHMSHRLVSLGLSEQRVVLLLGAFSIISGFLAVGLESLSYSLSLLLIPVTIILLALFTAFLGQIKLDRGANRGKVIGSLMRVSRTTSRFHIIELGLDSLILIVSYYLAYIVRFNLPLNQVNIDLFVASIPVILVSGLLAFILLGIYQSIWRYISLREIVRIGQASLLASVGAAFAIVLFFRFEDYSRQVFLIFPFILFLLSSLSRFSFRFFNSFFEKNIGEDKIPVLIYGAGDAGEFAIREIERNRNLPYDIVGFIDDDGSLRNRKIHGFSVLGGITDFEKIAESKNLQGLIISTQKIDLEDQLKLTEMTEKYPGIWIKRLKIEFEDA